MTKAIKNQVQRRCALATLSVWVTFGAPALAGHVLDTTISSAGSSPVRIDSCRAALVDRPGGPGVAGLLLTQRNYYIDAAVDFTDISPQALDGVRFVFDVKDTFGAVTQQVGLDWLGTFTPGTQIRARRNLVGAVGAVSKENDSTDVTQVVCHVQYARYSDGLIWKEGDRTAPVTPGLFYPTPYPSQSPHMEREEHRRAVWPTLF